MNPQNLFIIRKRAKVGTLKRKPKGEEVFSHTNKVPVNQTIMYIH